MQLLLLNLQSDSCPTSYPISIQPPIKLAVQYPNVESMLIESSLGAGVAHRGAGLPGCVEANLLASIRPRIPFSYSTSYLFNLLSNSLFNIQAYFKRPTNTYPMLFFRRSCGSRSGATRMCGSESTLSSTPLSDAPRRSAPCNCELMMNKFDGIVNCV